MNIRLATDTDQPRWDKAAQSFLQAWAWGDLQVANGRTIWRYVIEEAGTFVAGVLVIKYDLPFGFSWLYVPGYRLKAIAHELFQAEIKKVATQERAVFLRADIHDLASVPDGWRKAAREVQPKDTLWLDLQPSEDELLAGLRQKTRYNVRLAQKHGVQVRFSNAPADVEIFLDVAKHMSESGFSYHPDEYYRTFMNVLGPAGMVELAIAEYNGEALAAHMMVYANGLATYVHGASRKDKRALMAPQLLYWETIKRAKAKGLTTFDFYGVMPEGADLNHPWAGLTRVKSGFGGRRVSYAGAYDFICQPLWYSIMNMVRRIKNL